MPSNRARSHFLSENFRRALRAIKRVRKEFELAVAQEIKSFDDRKRSKLRAKTRLQLFVDESNWYNNVSQYERGKPGGSGAFQRSWYADLSGGSRGALSRILANRRDPCAWRHDRDFSAMDTENVDPNELPG